MQRSRLVGMQHSTSRYAGQGREAGGSVGGSMPSRPKRPCAHPGCPQLVDKGFCEQHQKYKRIETKEQRRVQDQRRGSAHERGYTSKWQRYSQWFLRQPDNVFCKLQLPGCTNLAQCVDHIQPPSNPDDLLFWRPENHQAACIHCNSVKGRRTMVGKAEPFEANKRE
jgi:5-methylcytosine-specific restriction protein A